MVRSTSTPTRSSDFSHETEAKIRALAKQVNKLPFRKAALYHPYPKQQLFHQLGKTKPERLLMAGNQEGKTIAGSFETHCHLTGMYPDWWEGRRWTHAIKAWAAGVTNRKTRDVVQQRLFGKRGKWGTGMIPKELIHEPVMSRGLSGLIDFVEVDHVSGGKSICWMKSYDESVDAWASDFIHEIWCDEEPPEAHWTEGLARLTTTGGGMTITFTPLKGISGVVRHFFPRPDTSERATVRMGLKDAKHIKVSQHEKLLAKYPEHERLARTEGLPVLGSGLVYTVPEHVVGIPAFQIPAHFAKLIAIDMGGGQHPFAAVLLAWDREADIIYVVDVYVSKEPQLAVHCSRLRHWGRIPVAWPHDVAAHSRGGGGQTYANLMRQEHLRMLPIHAQFEDGSNLVEPGIQLCHDRLYGGRLRVFDHLFAWFDEYRLYHRKEGKIVKIADDLMDATRYGVMMIRCAANVTPAFVVPEVVGMDYDPLKPPRQRSPEFDRL